MKLLVVCVLVLALTLVCADRGRMMQRRKLVETLMELKKAQDSMRQEETMLNTPPENIEQEETMLNTPPENIEDRCSLSALTCFRASLQVEFNLTKGTPPWKLYRSLKHSLTVKALTFCNTRNPMSSCQSCESHPKEDASVFFSRLKSLIQRCITKLSED